MKSAFFAASALVGATRLVTGVRPYWVGSGPTAAQRIYYANHSSHLDAVVIWAALPPAIRRRTSPVAASDYWDRSNLRRFISREVLNAVLIDRGTAGAREALSRIDAALDEGRSLIFFPEGSRGSGGHMGSIKAGLFHIARRHPKAELVPVYLQNLNRILPKGEFLPVPVLGSATFGAPLKTIPGESRQNFLDRARAVLIELGDRK